MFQLIFNVETMEGGISFRTVYASNSFLVANTVVFWLYSDTHKDTLELDSINLKRLPLTEIVVRLCVVVK